MDRTIADADLREDDLPSPNSDLWDAIFPFAHTFHWTDYYDNHLAMLSHAHSCMAAHEQGQLDSVSLRTLRAGLFLTCRAIRHTASGGDLPSGETVAYLHEIVETIRNKLRLERRDR